jgi:hypothetical protein
MTPRVALLALVLVAGSIGAPVNAHAERSWRAPLELTSNEHAGAGSARWTADVTTTSLGETIATWLEKADPDGERQAIVLSPGEPTAGPTPLGTSGGARLASDGVGNAYLAYSTAGSTAVSFRIRPPGGAFGSAESLETGGAVPRLLASSEGDVAAVWTKSNGQGTYAAIRPKGGTFGPARLLLNQSQGLVAAYSEGGDLVVAATADEYQTPRLSAAVLTGAGAVTTWDLATGSPNAARPVVGIDDDGRAIVAWVDQQFTPFIAVSGARVAQRPAGGQFGAPVSLPRAGGNGMPSPSLVMSRQGRYTLAYPGTRGLRVVTGQAGASPSYLRASTLESDTLSGDPSGNHVLFSGAPDRAVTSMRSGGGAFSPAQDLLTTCEQPDWLTTTVGDGGDSAALIEIGSRLLLATDEPGTRARKCYYDGIYDLDPYRPTPPDWAGSGDGIWVPGSDKPPPAPPSLLVGTPSVAKAKRGKLDRKARVVVVCGAQCTIKARTRLGPPGGETIASAVARKSSKGKADLVEIPLRLTKRGAKTLDRALKSPAPDGQLILTVTITATDLKHGKRTREINVPVPAPRY